MKPGDDLLEKVTLAYNKQVGLERVKVLHDLMSIITKELEYNYHVIELKEMETIIK